MIEPVYLDDGAVIICNEEGIIEGLPFNRIVTKADDWKSRTLNKNEDVGIFGTFFVCGDREESFTSLSPELMKKYKAKFAQAHDLFRFSSGQIMVVKIQAAVIPHENRFGQKPAKNAPKR